MSDGRQEREDLKVRLEREKKEDSEDRVDRDDADEGEPERGGS